MLEHFLKFKFLPCKIVKCLQIKKKFFVKENTGPNGELEIIILSYWMFIQDYPEIFLDLLLAGKVIYII